MATETLIDQIQALTADERDTVAQFIDFLKARKPAASPFQVAVDEFIEQHGSLLQRLAQ